jgi:hypothetical protein
VALLTATVTYHLSVACGVSCTQDDGKMMLFDIREHKAKHAIIVNTSKADLYAHEHYMDFNMLLGFADGELRHIDLRKPNLW